MERVLFVCGHNSGRSQIAEAIMEKLGGDDFEVKSAGLKPFHTNSKLKTAATPIPRQIDNTRF